MYRKYKVTNDRGRAIEVEEFGSFNEMLRILDSREPNEWADGHDGGRRDGEDSWCGGSYEKARDLLLHGWDEKTEEIREKYTQFTKANDTKKPKQYSSRVGYTPNVPNAIKGLPNAMFNVKLEPKKTKVIDVAIDLGVAARISTDEVIKKAVEVLAKVSSLEQSGYRVRITFLKTFNDNYSKLSYCCKLVLKNEFQPLDIKRVAFPLGHPAMFRRIMFDWYERFPDSKEFDGYGTSLGFTGNKQEISDMLTSPSQYVIHFNSDLDEVFKNLR